MSRRGKKKQQWLKVKQKMWSGGKKWEMEREREWMLKLTFDKRWDLGGREREKNRKEVIDRKRLEESKGRRGDAWKQMLKTEIERSKEEKKKQREGWKEKVLSCPLINDSSLVQVSVFSLFGGVTLLHLPLSLSLSHSSSLFIDQYDTLKVSRALFPAWGTIEHAQRTHHLLLLLLLLLLLCCCFLSLQLLPPALRVFCFFLTNTTHPLNFCEGSKNWMSRTTK